MAIARRGRLEALVGALKPSPAPPSTQPLACFAALILGTLAGVGVLTAFARAPTLLAENPWAWLRLVGQLVVVPGIGAGVAAWYARGALSPPVKPPKRRR